jgi:Tfp pilus assembly protein PilO
MSAKRFFMILLGVLAVILIAGGAGYYFASRSLHEGTSQLSQRLADEQLADEQLANLEDLKKQYERLQPLIPVINNALPDQKNQSRIAVQLHNIADQSGMRLDTLSFPASTTPGPLSQTVKEGDVLAIPVTFQLTGSYEQLQHFLTSQENLDRYTSITSLNINQTPKGLTFDINLSVFMKP